MKTCGFCKKRLPNSYFYKRRTGKQKGGLYTYCKPCDSKKRKDWYQKHKPSHNLRRLARIKKAQQFIIGYLRLHPCIDCQEPDILVLQFDHLRDKVKEIGYLVGNGRAIETIEAEIKKCQVVCANCHIRRTAKTFGYYRDKFVL